MDMTKIVCYKTRPAVILSKSNPELPTFVATVLYFVEEDDALRPCTEVVFDRTQLTDYCCPYINETVVPLIHCSDEGKCLYSAVPAKLSSMCLACKAESTAAFLRDKEV